MTPINSAQLLYRLRERNEDARRDVKLRGLRHYDPSRLFALLELEQSILDRCADGLWDEGTHPLALAILLDLAKAHRVTPVTTTPDLPHPPGAR